MELFQGYQRKQLAREGRKVDFLDGQSLGSVDSLGVCNCGRAGRGTVVGLRADFAVGTEEKYDTRATGEDDMGACEETEPAKGACLRVGTGAHCIGELE